MEYTLSIDLKSFKRKRRIYADIKIFCFESIMDSKKISKHKLPTAEKVHARIRADENPPLGSTPSVSVE